MEKETLEPLFKDYGFVDFKWISTKDIVVAQWVRFRCMFGCRNHGKKGSSKHLLKVWSKGML